MLDKRHGYLYIINHDRQMGLAGEGCSSSVTVGILYRFLRGQKPSNP